MKILAIDSSSTSCSAAIVENDRLIGEIYLNNGLTHSQTLMTMIDNLLNNAKININDIDEIAVTIGPGSFTGLRIGIATVKGLAFCSDKKCIGISTLETIAYNARFSNGIICAAMDARCSQVYNALFRAENGVITRITEDRTIKIDDLHKELENYNNEMIYIVGDGVNVAYKEGMVKLDKNNLMQRASSVAFLAQCKDDNEKKDCFSILPSYLSLPQAERELRARTKP